MDVLVPHGAGIAALADVPGVRAIRYRAEAPLPPEADTAEVLVAPFTATDEFVEALGRINAARGPVVDAALPAELVAGPLRAALDVTDPEPLPAGPLWSAPGLQLTPHVGGSVPQATDRAFRVAAEQIRHFAAGNTPSNLVQDGY